MDAPLAPEQGVDSPEQARELAIQRLKLKQDFKGLLAGGLFAMVIAVVIWAIGEGGYFWPIWVMLGVAIASSPKAGRPTARATGSPRPTCSGRWAAGLRKGCGGRPIGRRPSEVRPGRLVAARAGCGRHETPGT